MRPHEAGRVLLGVLRRLHDAPGQHQPPGRGVDQQRVRLAVMVRPFARRDLLRDQRIRRLRIRHAQQRLGEAHQRQPFRVRQAELLEEAFHHAGAARLRPRLQHDVARRRRRRPPLGRIQRRLRQQLRDALRFVLELPGIQRIGRAQAGGLGLRHDRHSCVRKGISAGAPAPDQLESLAARSHLNSMILRSALLAAALFCRRLRRAAAVERPPRSLPASGPSRPAHAR